MGEYTRVTIKANNGASYTLADRYRQLLDVAGREVGFSVLDRLRQGSYNAGVDASGGTHDAGGACDLSIAGMTQASVDRLVSVLRAHGCAAWHRTPDQGDWGPHVHSIDSGATDLSPQAAWQLGEYAAGRNGLASGEKDNGPNIRPLTPYVYVEDDPMEWTEKLPATAFSSSVKESLGDPSPNDPQQAGALQVNTAARLQRLEATVNELKATVNELKATVNELKATIDKIAAELTSS